MNQNVKMWLHGLGGAAVGAFVNALSNILVDPGTYNPHTLSGFKNLALSALISAGVAVGMYLKTSPLPGIDQKKVSE